MSGSQTAQVLGVGGRGELPRDDSVLALEGASRSVLADCREIHRRLSANFDRVSETASGLGSGEPRVGDVYFNVELSEALGVGYGE